MRKVSSAPCLSAMDTSSQRPHTSVAASHAGNGLVNKPASKTAFGGSLALKTKPETVKTQAFIFDTASAPPPSPLSDSEMAYVIASKGFVTATECLANLEELEVAPPLTGAPGEASARAMDVASCMATPVLPDKTNGELVANTARAMASQVEAEVKLRYANEISSNFNARPINAPRLRRMLSRKRSLDDLDLELYGHTQGAEDISQLAHTAVGSAKNQVTATTATSDYPSPETKRLLFVKLGMVEDCVSERNKTELPADRSLLQSIDNPSMIAALAKSPDADDDREEEEEEKEGEEIAIEKLIPAVFDGNSNKNNSLATTVVHGSAASLAASSSVVSMEDVLYENPHNNGSEYEFGGNQTTPRSGNVVPFLIHRKSSPREDAPAA